MIDLNNKKYIYKVDISYMKYLIIYILNEIQN